MLGIRNDDCDDLYGLLAVYYGMVRFIDDSVGQILDALERLGLRENTIVVFCSDHGDFMVELSTLRKTFSCKTAVLCPAARFDNAAFFELCAHNRGLSVKAFTSFEDAMDWLDNPFSSSS